MGSPRGHEVGEEKQEPLRKSDQEARGPLAKEEMEDYACRKNRI